MEAQTLLTYPEAAEILRCSPVALRKRVMLQAVPHVKPFGPRGRVFFLREDLDAFLRASRVPAYEPAEAR